MYVLLCNHILLCVSATPAVSPLGRYGTRPVGSRAVVQPDARNDQEHRCRNRHDDAGCAQDAGDLIGEIRREVDHQVQQHARYETSRAPCEPPAGQSHQGRVGALHDIEMEDAEQDRLRDVGDPECAGGHGRQRGKSLPVHLAP